MAETQPSASPLAPSPSPNLRRLPRLDLINLHKLDYRDRRPAWAIPVGVAFAVLAFLLLSHLARSMLKRLRSSSAPPPPPVELQLAAEELTPSDAPDGSSEEE